MTEQDALAIIRNAAKKTELIRIVNHATDRMRERCISMSQLLRCLRSGRITEGPYYNEATGDWKCTLEHYCAGENVGAAIALTQGEEWVIVVTVFYLR